MIGLPLGLAERVLESCAEFEERIWIIDNSGSMAVTDGHRLVSAAGAPRLVSCSRVACPPPGEWAGGAAGGLGVGGHEPTLVDDDAELF